MSSGLGFEQTLFFEETTTAYGNAETLDGSSLILPIRADFAIKKTIAEIETNHMRASASKQKEETANGLIDVVGAFGGTVPCTPNFTYLLKHCLGKVTTTGPSGSKYTHTYAWNDELFLGLSIGINRAGAGYAYHGFQIEKIEFNIQVGQPVNYTVTVVGKSEVPSAALTAPSLSLLAATPYYLAEHMTFQIDDVTETVTQMTIVLENELMKSESESYAIGSNERVGLGKKSHTVSGTIVRRHDRDGSGYSGNVSKFYDEFEAGTTAKLEANFANPDDADFNLNFTLDQCKVVAPNPDADGHGHMIENIQWRAYDLDDSASSIVMEDETATPATATGTYNGTGT